MNTNVPPVKVGQKLAPYNPTNPDCLQIAIDLLEIIPGDVVYDLGCGDGRFLVEVNDCECLG